MNKMRAGKFCVGRQFIKLPITKELKEIFGSCLILRAETMFLKDEIEYIAISEHFNEVDVGSDVPRYEIIFQQDRNGNLRWKFWNCEY